MNMYLGYNFSREVQTLELDIESIENQDSLEFERGFKTGVIVVTLVYIAGAVYALAFSPKAIPIPKQKSFYERMTFGLINQSPEFFLGLLVALSLAVIIPYSTSIPYIPMPGFSIPERRF